MSDFWSSVTVVAVAVLAIVVVEMWERWRVTMFPPDQRNHHQEERERQIDSLRLAARFPPPPGPKGYEAEGDRRTTKRHTVSEFHKSKVN